MGATIEGLGIFCLVSWVFFALWWWHLETIIYNETTGFPHPARLSTIVDLNTLKPEQKWLGFCVHLRMCLIQWNVLFIDSNFTDACRNQRRPYRVGSAWWLLMAWRQNDTKPSATNIPTLSVSDYSFCIIRCFKYFRCLDDIATMCKEWKTNKHQASGTKTMCKEWKANKHQASGTKISNVDMNCLTICCFFCSGTQRKNISAQLGRK